jgi:hypothetical protein
MQLTTFVLLSALGYAASATPLRPLLSRQQTQGDVLIQAPTASVQAALQNISINPLLVPAFGITRGIRINGTADCQGDAGVAIPCFCPPSPLDFLQKLDFAINHNGSNVLGTQVSFSNNASDQAPDTVKSRATACVVVLQNFNGSFGVGCPAVSAPNFKAQQLSGLVTTGTARDLIVAGVQ